MSEPILTWHRWDMAVTVKIHYEPEGHDTIRVEADRDLLERSPYQVQVVMNAIATIVEVMADASRLFPVVGKPTFLVSQGWERMAWVITCKIKADILEKIKDGKQETPTQESLRGQTAV